MDGGATRRGRTGVPRSRWGRRGAGLLVLVLVVGLSLAGTVPAVAPASAGTHGTPPDATVTVGSAPPVSSGAGATTQERVPGLQTIDADRTRVDVTLAADGDATWTLELWTRLDDDESRQAFDSLADDVDSDPRSFEDRFAERMQGTVADARNATGREMAIENVTVSTRTEGVPQAHGVLVYEFRWTGFAAVEGTELRAGAVIDGFLLESGTRLTLHWPTAYRATSVEPAADDRSSTRVTWRGAETDFSRGEPRVVLTSGPERSWILPLGGLLAVLGLAVAGWWLVRTGRIGRPGSSDRGSSAEPAESGETGTGPVDASVADGSPPSVADSEDPGSNEPGATAPSEGADADGDEPPAELLSNEEQVLRCLEANGGRLRQQEVVAELDWTEAKTSKVVTSMREDGTIEVFRIGRENVLTLPGETPT